MFDQISGYCALSKLTQLTMSLTNLQTTTASSKSFPLLFLWIFQELPKTMTIQWCCWMCHIRETACHVMAEPADSISETLRDEVQVGRLTQTRQPWDLDWGTWMDSLVRPLLKAQQETEPSQSNSNPVHGTQHLLDLRWAQKAVLGQV